MKTYTFLLLLILALGCTNGTKKGFDNNNSDSIKRNLVAKPQHTERADSNQNTFTKLNKASYEKGDFVYRFQNDTIQQEVVVNYIDKHSFKFHLISKNKRTNKKAEIDGIADDKPDQNSDLNSNTDVDGDDYFVRSYSFINHSKCGLDFDIEVDKKDKVQITEGGCNLFHAVSCPFASVGILKLVAH